MFQPKRIVFSGGGIRVIAFQGALYELGDAILKNVKEYIGVSAGAFLAFIILLGYSMEERDQIFNNLNFGIVRNLEPEQILEFDQNFGIDNGDNLKKLCYSLLKQKGFPPETTFSELCKTKNLIIFATDITLLKPREFSKKQTPNISVVTALLASMALPFYFIPVRDPVTDNLLTDGGCIINYPITSISRFELQDTLGLTFDDNINNCQKVDSFLTFFSQIMGCFWLQINKPLYEEYNNQTIIIPCSLYPSWNFEASLIDKKMLYDCGKNATKEFLLRKKERPLYRRRSIS